MYIYKTTIYISTTNVIGAPATNASDLSDFVTNFKNQAYEVSAVNLLETSFLLTKTYAQFKALVSNPIVWGDVKYVVGDGRYDLSLLTENSL